jgi:dienelactone hydrolase
MKRIIGTIIAVNVCILAWLIFFPQKLDGLFSAPSGSHAVGTMHFHLTDPQRADNYNHDAAHPQRELMITMWYPTAEKGPSHPLDTSIQNQLTQRQQLPANELTQIMVSATDNAPLNAGTTRLPIVIIMHGLYSFAANHTTQAEELASRGYVVVGINHTGIALFTTFPDGRNCGPTALEAVDISSAEGTAAIMQLYLDDATYVLDQLEKMNADVQSPFHNRLDLGRIGFIGHSFGGAAATQLCKLEPRCKAAINFDGSLAGDNPTQAFQKPYLIMLAEKQIQQLHHEAEQKCAAQGLSKEDYACRYFYRYLEAIPELCKNLGTYAETITIAGADHHTFVDLPYIKALCVHDTGTITALEKMRQQIREAMVAFCDKNLS